MSNGVVDREDVHEALALARLGRRRLGAFRRSRRQEGGGPEAQSPLGRMRERRWRVLGCDRGLFPMEVNDGPGFRAATTAPAHADCSGRLRKYRAESAFHGEGHRREHLMTELWKGRLTGIRLPVPVEAFEGRLLGPAGRTDRSEVRFAGTQEPVAQTVHAGAEADERLRALRSAHRGGGDF